MGFLSAFNKKPVGERQHSVEKLSEQIAAHLDRLETKGGSVEERTLTVIARSPTAAVAQAVGAQAKALIRNEVTTRLIFARIAPLDQMLELAASLEVAPREGKCHAIRIIRTAALLNAHEQLVLGQSCCWTGDMLRRSEENRNGLDLWEVDAPGSVKLGQLAFDAIWQIAKPIPARLFSPGVRVVTSRTPLTPAVAAAGLASESAMRAFPGSPVTRH